MLKIIFRSIFIFNTENLIVSLKGQIDINVGSRDKLPFREPGNTYKI